MIDQLLAATALGALGGFHCAAMCGPLASAGCGNRSEATGYLLGRSVAYVFVGALLGGLGLVLHRDALHSFHLTVTVLLATAFLVRGITSLYRARTPKLVRLPRRSALGRLLPRRGLGLGLVTGALPCGLLFGAWAIAATTTRPLHGAAVMLVFSLVTLPGLLAPLLARPLIRRYMHRLPSFVPGVAWCLLGVWIAVRPLFMATHEGCH